MTLRPARLAALGLVLLALTVPAGAARPALPFPASPVGCAAPSILLGAPSVAAGNVSVPGSVSPGAGGCSILGINWSWGDGSTGLAGLPASHAYTRPGAFGVTAVAVQSDGQSASSLTNVTVEVVRDLGPGPGGRTFASMAYDPHDGGVVLFGGLSASAILNDTWSFRSGAWRQLPTVMAPSPREQATMAWDARDGYLLLFGGIDAGATALGDTWSFVGGHWRALYPPVSPAARAGAMMTYDAQLGEMVLFGGYNAAGKLNDTWTYASGNWTRLNLSVAPDGRVDAGLAYNPDSGRVILYGGGTFGTFRQTWAFTSAGWSRLAPGRTPPSVDQMVMTWDPALRADVLVGGSSHWRVLNQSWEYAGGHWTPATFLDVPSPRNNAGLAYDPGAGGLLLFGGQFGAYASASSYLADTWTLA